MTPARSRRTLYQLGRHGDRVRVLVDTTRGRVEVLFRDVDRIPRKRIFPNDKQGREEAIAWADTFKQERERLRREGEKPAPISTRALWEAYLASPDWDGLRPPSKLSYRFRWQKWETFIGRDRDANTITLRDIDTFIVEARKAGTAINQARQVLNTARIVYRWGQSRRLLSANDFGLYRWKQPKDAAVLKPDAYTAEDWSRLLGKLEPQHRHRWRLAVAMLICHATGQRINAVRHLRDQDISDALVRWPKEWQKQGRELARPLMWDLVAALETARYWRAQAAQGRVRHDRKVQSRPAALRRSDWLLFAQNRKGEAVSYSSLHTLLLQLERRAKVKHRKWRAFHGLKRKVVTELIDKTGDKMLALEYVGNRDAAQLQSYDRGEGERMADVAAKLEGDR